MFLLGEIAAVLTSITYAVNSTLFTVAGRKVGAMVVNRIRLAAACLFLAAGVWLFSGAPWPVDAGLERWFWLGLSGIVGLVIGDAFLFQAFVWIGPRLSMLMMSLAPIIAAATAWIFLGESLSGFQIGGMVLTLLGVSWVIMDKNHTSGERKENFLRGILFGLGAAAGQGLGLVLAKPGLGDSYSPFSANFIRMFTAFVLMWFLALVSGKFKSTLRAVQGNPKALVEILAGAFSGPFLGVSLSLFALQHTSVGVAGTLMALAPIFLLPLEYFYFKQSTGWGSILGTVLALIGVGVLFLF
jgi:drug/metabolite transporter (DMT)-like permease